ncbi:DUF1905 domain-containing protein [Pseudonocardia eucalypti]|uniref:DUF1905 domain-containing protein n=1 Tax=Pseudonocardia eucalypti TaxID=648755 RepID=UPI00160B5866
MELVFTGQVIEWRGPAPYYFVPVPEDDSAAHQRRSRDGHVRMGSVIPVQARIGGTTFRGAHGPPERLRQVTTPDAVRPHVRSCYATGPSIRSAR